MLIKGNTYTDHRGTVAFVNGFYFEGIKRFYCITHPGVDIVRAWQGHQSETKYFFAVRGVFQIAWVIIDQWEQPSRELVVQSLLLRADQSQILLIAPGCANGFRALEPDSILMVFSDKTLKESQADDHRWESDYFKGIDW